MYDYLQKTSFNHQIKVLGIMCDGCTGQNKNTSMVAMLGKWLYSEAPKSVKKVEIIYPVAGHSLIPPDRVFPLIEKELKNKEVVTFPKEYVRVLENDEKAIYLSNVTIYGWRNSYGNILKHIDAMLAKAWKMSGFVIRSTKPFKRKETILTLYHSLIRSILDYCFPIWCPSYKIYVKRIEAVQKKYSSTSLINQGSLKC